MGNKTILVTGGAGYIGSHVVKLLGEAGHNVIVYDNLSTGFKDAVTYGELVEGDLEDLETLESVFANNKIDGVMHFAGSIVVPESVENPLKYYTNNTLNSLNLVKMCVKHNVENFIFSSTAAVYGMLETGKATEETKKEPINPYGQSKLMTELMLKDTSIAHENFNYVALRYFNVSGADPEGKIGQAFPGATHLIKVNCEAAAGKREKTYIFGTDFETADGTGVRDYIHVMDLAQAHLDALEFLFKNKTSEVFNCGYGHGFSVREVVNSVKEVTGANYPVEEAPRRAGDPAELVSIADKIKKTIGWQPKYDDLAFIIKTAFEWERGETLSSWIKKK
ncbi:MAG: UDP-glucose 4-epimerase GalE [Halobacteriovoraceae bacterium]|nr:UDP-glucose 4-epimerase GalE [Halobacteriovoraceae bacterium]